MKDLFPKKRIKYMIAAAAVIMAVAVMALLGLYKCPLDGIFGIPCMLCGISRAFFSLLRGDIRSSFYYHPLWPVVVVYAIAALLYSFGLINPSKKAKSIALFVLCAMFVICYVLRHITASPVVAVHFDTSLIGYILGSHL